MITFVGRKRELEMLDREYGKGGFSFFPIYGRRRIGKTELIKQFIKDKDHIYFQCIEGTERENMLNLKEAAKETIDLSPIRGNIEDIFRYISQMKKKRFIVVMDEYPYLAGVNKGLSSRMQRIIDEIISDSSIFLILCGSSVKMMYREVLDSKAPLYGRRTGQIELGPLGFREGIELLGKPLEECVRIWSVCGGIPYYLNEFTGKGSFFKQLEDKVLLEDGILRKEGEFLLGTELDEMGRYASIIKAISMGHTRVGRIVSYCGLSERISITPYLNTLERLGFIRKEISIDGSGRSKGLYRIDDEFIRFHFTFIRPYQTTQQRMARIRKDHNRFLDETFERICKSSLIDRYPSLRIGRWWHREDEIDLVGVDPDGNSVLFIECKWKDLNIGEVDRIRAYLKKKAGNVKNRPLHGSGYGIMAKRFKGGKEALDLDLEDIAR